MNLHLDTVIHGGGAAALWTANALRAAGRSVVVLSNAPLGSGQTLAAQGVIHGGLKYAAGGKLTESSEALARMPARWQVAQRGEDAVDLRRVRVLSDHQVLWSLPGVVSQVASFFGSVAVRGRARSLAQEEAPELFRHPDYRGRLFRLEEQVIDPRSLVEALAEPLRDWTFLVNSGQDHGSNAHVEAGPEGVAAVHLGDGLRLTADVHLFAAGAGNAALLAAVGREAPAMQTRPLHQVVFRSESLPDFFSVCIGRGRKPPLVSTTHRDSNGRTIWYLGGDLAEEKGVARSEKEQAMAGRGLLAELLPWVDLAGAECFTLRAERAEPVTRSGDRPPGAFCEREGNVITAWPTKLALVPDLADQVLAEIDSNVSSRSEPAANQSRFADLNLPHPGIGKPPWDRA